MLDGSIELPNVQEFLEELEDGDTARDFLMHMVGLGYVLQEVEGKDIRTISDAQATKIARHQFTIFYLAEYQAYGELEQ